MKHFKINIIFEFGYCLHYMCLEPPEIVCNGIQEQQAIFRAMDTRALSLFREWTMKFVSGKL